MILPRRAGSHTFGAEPVTAGLPSEAEACHVICSVASEPAIRKRGAAGAAGAITEEDGRRVLFIFGTTPFTSWSRVKGIGNARDRGVALNEAQIP
jgi:hypothetical protein